MTPFVALVPEAASGWLLPARIGHVRAYAMFALGEPLDATAALGCGLANAVVPAAELQARAWQAAEALTKRPAGSLFADIWSWRLRCKWWESATIALPKTRGLLL